MITTTKAKDPIITDILKWYNNNMYTRIGSDVSVTELMEAPRIAHLRSRHGKKVPSKDLSNELPAIIGMSVHSGLQRYLRTEANVTGKWLIERKMIGLVDGIRIAGKFDALRDLQHLYDIKVTRIWKYIFGGQLDFEKQLNMYDYMLWKDGYNVKSLSIMMVLLDWSPGKIWEKNYPQERIQIIPITKWTRNEQDVYIKDRIKKWKDSKDLADDKLPECTFDERWAEKEVFKLYRTPTAKRSTKNFDTLTGAKSYQDACITNDASRWKKSRIESCRANPWKRCKSWCKIAPFCNQFMNRMP